MVIRVNEVLLTIIVVGFAIKVEDGIIENQLKNTDIEGNKVKYRTRTIKGHSWIVAAPLKTSENWCILNEFCLPLLYAHGRILVKHTKVQRSKIHFLNTSRTL